MPRLKPQREFYIPQGARRVKHKYSSALVYLYEAAGQVKALAFHGRAQKPDWHYRWPDNERGRAMREARVREHFAKWGEWEGRERDRRAKPHGLKVGDVLRASWGYDQTNIDYYEVVKLIGKSMVDI